MRISESEARRALAFGRCLRDGAFLGEARERRREVEEVRAELVWLQASLTDWPTVVEPEQRERETPLRPLPNVDDRRIRSGRATAAEDGQDPRMRALQVRSRVAFKREHARVVEGAVTRSLETVRVLDRTDTDRACHAFALLNQEVLVLIGGWR